jgi:hypothetical protein
VGAFRDCVLHVIKKASWKLTLAAALAVASRLAWPVLPDEAWVQAMLTLSALSLGACVGREIDRKLRPKKQTGR